MITANLEEYIYFLKIFKNFRYSETECLWIHQQMGQVDISPLPVPTFKPACNPPLQELTPGDLARVQHETTTRSARSHQKSSLYLFSATSSRALPTMGLLTGSAISSTHVA